MFIKKILQVANMSHMYNPSVEGVMVDNHMRKKYHPLRTTYHPRWECYFPDSAMFGWSGDITQRVLFRCWTITKLLQ